MAAESGKKKSYNWPPDKTRALIHFRASNEEQFTKSKQAPKKLWDQFVKEAGLEGTVGPQQAAKKCENLKTRYKELKNSKTGSGTDGGEETASTWKYFQDMHEVLGGRPSIDPPLVVASFTAEGDPTAILEEIVGCPSTNEPSAAADGQSTPDAGPPTTTSASPPTTTSTSPPTPSPKKKKNNPVVDFLKSESEREQKRHEESEAKTERFLGLFEKMVDKM